MDPSANTVTLELVSCAFIDPPGQERFDFSGLERAPGKGFYLLDDNRDGIYFFSGQIRDTVQVEEVADLSGLLGTEKGDLDLESIRSNGEGKFVLAHEKENRIILWDPAKKQADFVAPRSVQTLFDLGFTPTHGLEAVCWADEDVLMIKETRPVLLVRVSLPDGIVEEVTHIRAPEEIADVTDCLYIDPTLYLLYRSGWQILLAERDRDEYVVRSIWDFSRIKRDPRFDYFIPDPVTRVHREDWGVAEALAMDDDYVYIGLDNNGEPLRSYEGERRATVIVFKRPNRGD
jgi:hypothetical protein